ncbi:NAD(P)H-dependent oxidoreductase [Pacificoceanicola onchidii]|uniref:NAD(P)H-dependent oxidoreductase n=1 Tax=Pacificoceanicola onchidii TaxID=2562685 RepID=UPI0010A5D1CF|nr:NAD(P)H-dependent oxidoreductase [Pacificoceanicola onchidii]
MSRIIVYFAHPGQKFSRANLAMAKAAQRLADVTFVDLYAEYPRHDIDVEKEQARLLAHDIIVFQFPLYWYSTPSLVKEWQDLVLQHGFAYGHGGDRLAGKTLLVATTAGGSEEAYTPEGYQHFPLRRFLTPLEQTARLCKMTFAPPVVLYSALKAHEDREIAAHAAAYAGLLSALRAGAAALPEDTGETVLTTADLETLLPALQKAHPDD